MNLALRVRELLGQLPPLRLGLLASGRLPAQRGALDGGRVGAGGAGVSRRAGGAGRAARGGVTDHFTTVYIHRYSLTSARRDPGR